jgi:5-methylcytosine-specific restriction endonuclease McrA
MNDQAAIRDILAAGLLYADQAEVAVRAKFKCEYCGLDFLKSPEHYRQWVWDHVVPRHRGGGEDSDNKAAACRICNLLKGVFDPTNAGKNMMSRSEKIKAAQEYIHPKKIEWDQYEEGRIQRFRDIVKKWAG